MAGLDPAKSAQRFCCATKHWFRFLDVFTYQKWDVSITSNLKTWAPSFFWLFKVRMSLCQDLVKHLVKRRRVFFSTWEMSKSWDSTLLFWITWCVDLIVGLGQKKSIPKSLVTNSQFVYLCAVLILRDVPSMFVSDDYLSQGGNLCTHWDIKREGASNKDNIVTNVRTSSIPWEYWMTHERPKMHLTLLSLMLLHYIDSFFPKSCLCQFLTATVPKRD